MNWRLRDAFALVSVAILGLTAAAGGAPQLKGRHCHKPIDKRYADSYIGGRG